MDGVMNGMDPKRLRAAALLALFFCLCLLPGCGGKDKEEGEGGEASELPTEYTVGEGSVAALAPAEDSTAALHTVMSYQYTQLEDAGSAVSSYVRQLEGEESGFSVVDEEYVVSEKPDFSQPEGQVLLAKNLEGTEEMPVENRLVYVRVTWSEGACTVVADEADGQVTTPPPPPSGMTLLEAQDYLSSLSPAALGLSGESMKEYSIYTMNGAVLVDGNPCVRLNVYSNDNEQHTNELVACFLMNGNGTKLYRLEVETNTVQELDIVRS